MAIHCGTDIIEVDRIKKSIEEFGDKFIQRVFSSDEITYCESKRSGRFESYAVRFAAKEAVAKAFGTGIAGEINLHDIIIRNDAKGKPHVELFAGAHELFKKMKGKKISISLSHCREYAVAYVILET